MTNMRPAEFYAADIFAAHNSPVPPHLTLALIRKLLSERINKSLFGRWFLNVDYISDARVLATPEATVVAIVLAYHGMKNLDFSDAEALAAIERHRSKLKPGNMPKGTRELEDYVCYRVALEHRKERRMTGDEVLRAIFMANQLVKTFGPARVRPQEGTNVSDVFIGELPDIDANTPIGGVVKLGNHLLTYFENPRSIGSMHGIESPYKYPQVVVVSDEKGPWLIIRTELGANNSLFLCSLNQEGIHRILEHPIKRMRRDDFIRTVAKHTLLAESRR